MGATKETLGFQTEVKQLLHLMVHALYSNKEIFLRELISNASDACDKLRFEALSDPSLYGDDNELSINIDYDNDARTLTIRDNGIGMSRDEAIANLGTIAKSGTREFFKQLTGDAQKDSHLIGQFGVGFYASFIVADKVSVRSRRAGLGEHEGVLWESTGDGEFTVEAISLGHRGTEVTLHLREGEGEFASGWRLRELIRRYSDHITLPITMKKEEWDDKESKQKRLDEIETVNQAKAMWTRSKQELTDADYQAFYKHVAHDFEDPLTWVHARVEGTQEYTLLLYIPKRAPFDLWDRHTSHGVKLYVRRVFIMDDADKLMPAYLRFVRGVIDSSDLPLNISREILQESKDIEAIRNGATRKVLAMLDDLAANEPERYQDCWSAFGRVLKEGISEDHNNRDRIAKLIRFASTLTDQPDETVSLADYVGRMKPEQSHIYYITAESFNAAKNSPHLEIFRKKGIEVLLLADRIDEWVVAGLTEFDGKPLQSVAKGDLDLGKLADEDDKKAAEEAADTHKPLIDKIKQSLGERVKDVRVTHRLTESPACLISDQWGMSANLARILEASGQKAPAVKPILEINPNHPMVLRLEREEARFDDWTKVLFDQALLAEGGVLDDPGSFVRTINQLMLDLARPS